MRFVVVQLNVFVFQPTESRETSELENWDWPRLKAQAKPPRPQLLVLSNFVYAQSRFRDFCKSSDIEKATKTNRKKKVKIVKFKKVQRKIRQVAWVQSYIYSVRKIMQRGRRLGSYTYIIQYNIRKVFMDNRFFDDETKWEYREIYFEAVISKILKGTSQSCGGWVFRWPWVR